MKTTGLRRKWAQPCKNNSQDLTINCNINHFFTRTLSAFIDRAVSATRVKLFSTTRTSGWVQRVVSAFGPIFYILSLNSDRWQLSFVYVCGQNATGKNIERYQVLRNSYPRQNVPRCSKEGGSVLILMSTQPLFGDLARGHAFGLPALN